MANPVRELLTILDEWAVPKGSNHTHIRGGGGLHTTQYEFWRNVTPAIRLCLDAEAMLNEMDSEGIPVESHRRFLGVLFRAVIAPEESWGTTQNSGKQLLSQDQRASIELLAGVLDGRQAAGLTSAKIGQIVEQLSEIELLIAESEVADGLRERLVFQVSQARRFAEDIDRFGEAVVADTLADVVSEAYGFTKRDDVNPDRRKRIQWLVTQIVLNAAGNAAFQGVLLAIGVAPEVLALTSAVSE